MPTWPSTELTLSHSLLHSCYLTFFLRLLHFISLHLLFINYSSLCPSGQSANKQIQAFLLKVNFIYLPITTINFVFYLLHFLSFRTFMKWHPDSYKNTAISRFKGWTPPTRTCKVCQFWTACRVCQRTIHVLGGFDCNFSLFAHHGTSRESSLTTRRHISTF